MVFRTEWHIKNNDDLKLPPHDGDDDGDDDGDGNVGICDVSSSYDSKSDDKDDGRRHCKKNYGVMMI